MRQSIAGGVISVLGTMVGAGLASGQEIMRFFSRYGVYSWALVLCAAMVMGACVYVVMRYGARHGVSALGAAYPWSRALLWLAITVTGGGMLAAMGEVCALCVPVRGARQIGMALFLLLGCALSSKGLAPLQWTGAALLPMLLVAFALCLRARPQLVAHGAPPSLPLGALACVGYALLNVLLSFGVLCEVGARCVTSRALGRCAWMTGIAMALLLLLGNAALVRHAPALMRDALPMVRLLSGYGGVGFWLAAALLLLAAFTTLLGALRTLFLMTDAGCVRRAWIPLSVALCALIGFQSIVGRLYPLVGWLGLLALLATRALRRVKRRPARLAGRHKV